MAPPTTPSTSGGRYVDVSPTTGWTGQTSVVIKVTDPGGLFSTDTFQVTVTAPDEPDIDVYPTSLEDGQIRFLKTIRLFFFISLILKEIKPNWSS